MSVFRSSKIHFTLYFSIPYSKNSLKRSYRLHWSLHMQCNANIKVFFGICSGIYLSIWIKIKIRIYFISYILFNSKQSLEYPKVKIRIIRMLELPQNHYQDYIRLFFRNKFEFFLQYQQGRWLARFAGSLEPARSNKLPGFFIIRDT